MKLSTFIFHVDSLKEEDLRILVAEYLKHFYPDAEKRCTLTLTENHRLVVATYDYEWFWSEVSMFVDSVLRNARVSKILVVCESVKFD